MVQVDDLIEPKLEAAKPFRHDAGVPAGWPYPIQLDRLGRAKGRP
jgi:hypothetical protein